VSRPKLVGVAVAVVLAAALVATGRLLDLEGGAGRGPAGAAGATTITISTRAPDRIGGKVECPPDWPVLATADHRSYPAGHPTRPPASVRAVGCYQTAELAAGAGYAPAPPPAGVLEIGGVYLVPTSQGFRDRCRRIADRLGFAVPCPGLLPTSPPGVPPPRLCGFPRLCTAGRLLMFVQDQYAVPFGYVGIGDQGSLLVLLATPGRPMAGQLGPQCRHELRIGEPTVHGVRAVQATCVDDAHESVFGGAELLRWSSGGTFLVIAVAGRGQVNQRLAVALADHVRMAEPRP
jgi:hypothetical protein